MSPLEQRAAQLMHGNEPMVTLRRAADIQCVPIRWLWPGYIARGKLHILAGAPGTGKTTIALALAAAVSSGGRWPGGTLAPVGNVLIWSGEDDPADTLAPRLRAAGANLSRIFFIDDTRDGGDLRAFDPATDLAALEIEAERIGDVSLLIADPVVSAVAGDSHKNTEVRRALQPMVNLASRLGCAVLGISHFSKGTAGRDPTERVTGSIAFGALARVVLVTAKRSDDGAGPGRLLARAKSNIGPDGGGFGYALEQVDTDGIQASRVTWGAALDGSARELLDEIEEHGPDGGREDAADWLRDMLDNGPVPVKSLQSEARAAGISWRTVERAKSDTGVNATRASSGNSGGGFWSWHLPGKSATGKADSPISKFGGLAESRINTGPSATSQRARPPRPPSFERGNVAADLPASAVNPWGSET